MSIRKMTLTVDELLRKCPLIYGPITSTEYFRHYNTVIGKIIFNHKQYVAVTIIEKFLDLDKHILDVKQSVAIITFTLGVDPCRETARKWAEQQTTNSHAQSKSVAGQRDGGGGVLYLAICDG